MYCHLARPLLPLHTASAHAFYHLTSYFGMSDARWHVRPKHAVTSPCVRVRLTLLGGVVPLFSVGCGHESSEALRLHSVGGRRLPDAALEPTFDGCPAAARGSSMAARRSSRRRPWCHRGVPRCPEEAALEVRTAVERRACCLPLASRSTRTHYRAEGPLEPL